MNPKIKKTRDELERTKAKIAELQALVPQLERVITDMENADIIRAVRSADIAPADLPAFLASLKNTGAATEPTGTQTPGRDSPRTSGYNTGTTGTVNPKEDDDTDV